MTNGLEAISSPDAELCACPREPAWFCLRSQMKREHVAAAHLRQLPGVEAFNPQLRLLRSTRRGPKWFTESLFPNYLFARFTLEAMLEKVGGTPAVQFVVRFGDVVPVVPEPVIEELRRQLDGVRDLVLTDTPMEGEEVEITAGAFAGMKGLVTRVLPGGQRVRILLDIMGRAVPAELSLESVLFNRRNGAQVALDEAGVFAVGS